MSNIFAYSLVYVLLFVSFSTQAQSLDNHIHSLRLKKIDATGDEVAFTVKDAINLVRFFMTQEEVHKCESNLYNNTLKIISRKGHSLEDLLLEPLVFKQMLAMGYHIEMGDDDHLPNSVTTRIEDNDPEVGGMGEDCKDCGEIELSEKFKKGIPNKGKYSGDALFLGSPDNPPIGGNFTPRKEFSEAQKDSIRKALNLPLPPN